MPGAEVAITASLVRALLREQHPDLAALPLRVAAHGWDNLMVRLGEALAVRLPRRAAAVALIETELSWLAEAAGTVRSARVPVPVRRGRPGAGYPWPWSVVPWIEGRPAVTVPRPDRARLAGPLALACRELHRPAPAGVPGNPVRGVPLVARDAAVRRALASGAVPRGDAVARVWEEAMAAPAWSGPPMWVHGDLHPANLVVGAHGLAGVVDFGDLTAGDPATDLATAWLTFDAAGRAAFRQALDGAASADAATWQRARGWAVVLGVALCAASDDAPVLAELGRETLDQVRTP
ncbi:aminoglycoside phosphotransferase family protein [Georgenia sp. 10Sc9-8]|uniref:Aminoglycoside phosphotransferase family protein n=1 Tax=Georgenia halotolerans TaxID=3028317 RepID=A0ABT5TUP3_9MICO|nr:aminoglycoside phosphotransferase family protein [Georgenia halotolerans]